MNICLVNPTPEKNIELAGIGIPNIGLGYLSSYLKKNMDHIFEMVCAGESGYIKPVRKFKWDEFNKQNQNPLRYKYVNHRVLRAIQIFGYVYHALGNFRIKSLIS
jgi:hypothetical protein